MAVSNGQPLTRLGRSGSYVVWQVAVQLTHALRHDDNLSHAASAVIPTDGHGAGWLLLVAPCGGQLYPVVSGSSQVCIQQSQCLHTCTRRLEALADTDIATLSLPLQHDSAL